MNRFEKEVFSCFSRPRTLEEAYKRSSFNNIHNFKMCVDRLLSLDELEEELRVKHKDNFFQEDRIISQKKKQKTDLTQKIDNFASGLGMLFCIATIFFSWHNINILELF